MTLRQSSLPALPELLLAVGALVLLLIGAFARRARDAASSPALALALLVVAGSC